MSIYGPAGFATELENMVENRKRRIRYSMRESQPTYIELSSIHYFPSRFAKICEDGRGEENSMPFPRCAVRHPLYNIGADTAIPPLPPPIVPRRSPWSAGTTTPAAKGQFIYCCSAKASGLFASRLQVHFKDVLTVFISHFISLFIFLKICTEQNGLDWNFAGYSDQCCLALSAFTVTSSFRRFLSLS